MTQTLYEKLARRLDAIPSGFPRTESGIELRVLEKLFTPEQAALALHLKLTCDSPETIARRASKDVGETRQALKQMVRDGLIRAERGKNGIAYGLLPFVVGIYEMNLHRMDAELASLMEAFMKETGATNPIYASPPVHRVIPVEESIPFKLGIHSHDSATAMIENAASWGVRDCICRVQKKLIGEGCDHPVEICISFAAMPNAFDHVAETRPINKEEALGLLRQAAEAGLVHTTGNYRDGHNYICNCCTCSCGVLRGLAEFDVPTAIAHSGYQSVIDASLCVGCGKCVTRCQFGAIALVDRVAVVDTKRCVGCGNCVAACAVHAIRMERRPLFDQPRPPATLAGWMIRRGVRRGGKFIEVL